MRARRCILCVVTLFVLSTVAAAGDTAVSGPAAELEPSTPVPESDAIQPWINASMSVTVREKLEVAFDLALQRVREVPACGDLFTQLGADGATSLSQTLYFPVRLYREDSRCRSSHAVTRVGVRPTMLCRRFGHLSDSAAAAVLIHEALHLAGLTEYPSDPDAMTSRAIARMVRGACDLVRGETREEALSRRPKT